MVISRESSRRPRVPINTDSCELSVCRSKLRSRCRGFHVTRDGVSAAEDQSTSDVVMGRRVLRDRDGSSPLSRMSWCHFRLRGEDEDRSRNESRGGRDAAKNAGDGKDGPRAVGDEGPRAEGAR
eukprot:Gregarina_sp_Pseudo_9__676@NODE_142_length_3984_cov_16_033714_g130_i0_p5_GENE_NODE_142_length_3984_cov_16_033714_g130_i0NODE_142_length_3984_cov_16_033714_g130_i0_p5_ORF_typecomplete_len124_score15_54_NODE_142_length_3984_cov_16_033714_g130_i027283099